MEATSEVEPAPVARTAPVARLVGGIDQFRRNHRGWNLTIRYLPRVAVVCAIGFIAVHNHFLGIDWGDDFSLYVRQAKSLTTGNVSEVARQNRFIVDNSGWHSFSPYTYPWGWPVLMAPVYWLFGLDYGAIKVEVVVAFCIFLLAFYAVVRRRTPRYAAVVVTLLIGFSPAFLGFTDTVLSDLPYLCFVALSLWWMDRCRLSGLLDGKRATGGSNRGVWALVLLGFLIGLAFNIRREGLCLVAALAAQHAVLLGERWIAARRTTGFEQIDWRRLVLPYAAFAATALAFQVALPSELIPGVPGPGVHNVSGHLGYYADALAEQIGLKDPGVPMQLFHSQGGAQRVLAFFVLFAAIGMIGRLVKHLVEDVALAAYLVGTSLVILISPYQEPRYLFTITPFLAYFAYQALPTIAELSLWRGRAMLRFCAIAPAVVLAGLTASNAVDLKHAFDYHSNYQYVEEGPEQPVTKDMFAMVRQLTGPDDVILFARARVMALYTDRRAVQGSDLNLLLPRSDWYVMQKGSNYAQTPLTDEEAAARGLTKSWENPAWVIWRTGRR